MNQERAPKRYFPRPMDGSWNVSAADPAKSRHPQLAARIATAGWDAGAA